MVDMAVDRDVITEVIALHFSAAGVPPDLLEVRPRDQAVGIYVTDQ